MAWMATAFLYTPKGMAWTWFGGVVRAGYLSSWANTSQRISTKQDRCLTTQKHSARVLHNFTWPLHAALYFVLWTLWLLCLASLCRKIVFLGPNCSISTQNRAPRRDSCYSVPFMSTIHPKQRPCALACGAYFYAIMMIHHHTVTYRTSFHLYMDPQTSHI